MSTESESVSPLNTETCSLVLVDVAGTTSSIKFVKETLFPFVTAQVEQFLKSKWDEDPVKDCINLIKEDAEKFELAAAVEKVKTLIKEESNNKGLKTLQGLIYKEGYEKGDLKAHIFEDVAESFESWAKNRRVAIYSTGSVDSQKLLFSHTVHGDVSGHIHKYFDQNVGVKTESDSYKAIAKNADVAPEEIVFITDDIKEAKAAKNSGLTAVLIKREGNAELPEDAKEFTVISSFKELVLDKAPKRKIEVEATVEEAPPTKVAKTEDAEKPKETEELMEVDSEKKPDETEKTENTPKETEKITAEAEKTESIDVEMKDGDEKVEKEEVEDEKKVEETKVTTEETKPKENEKVETKTEEKTPQKEEKAEEKQKPEVAEETPAEKTKDVTTEEKVETKPEEKKVEETKPEETKPEETKVEEKPEIEEKPLENGEEKSESPKTEEKENKSVLANGVENGKKESEEENAGVSTTDGEEKPEEPEVKIKKLEESAESKTVSVEV